MTGIRITPFGTVPKISTLVIDGDLNLGANKLLTNVIEASTEDGVMIDNWLTCTGVTALMCVATPPSSVGVLYTDSTSYQLALYGSEAEADIFSITVPPGYTAKSVSVTVEATINVKNNYNKRQTVYGYINIYVNGALKSTLSHSMSMYPDADSEKTQTDTLTGMSPGDVILVRGYGASNEVTNPPLEATLKKFEIKGDSVAFVKSENPIAHQPGKRSRECKMMVEISTDFFIGSIISGFSVLTMWLYSVSGKVENIDGTLQEHLRNEKRR